MKFCNICGKISGTGKDHIDCIQKRRIDLEVEDAKMNIPERIDMTKNADNLGTEIKAILEHMTREKSRDA